MPDPTTTTTLTDRYVWTVTRHLDADTGPDVARELRGTIHDMVEAKLDSGIDAGEAERAALTELGDPDTLARQYGGRPSHLIGPGMYSEYVRLMRILLAIVIPFTVLGMLIDGLEGPDQPFDVILLDTAIVLVSVAVHVMFWTTLVFAVIERRRPAAVRDRPLTEWSTTVLPTDVPSRQVTLSETAWSVGFQLVAIAVFAWQFAGVAQNGQQLQVLDPDLAMVWKTIIIGLFVAGLALAVAVRRARRWTPTLAVVNVLLNVAETAVLVWLIVGDELIVDDLPQQLADVFGVGADWTVPTGLLAMAVVLVTTWSSVDSVRRARIADPSPRA